MNKVYGIDFGTSNSAVAILDNDRAEVLPIGMDGKKTIPMLLFFSDACRITIGDQAIAEYVAGGMKGRLLQSIKSFLPHPGFTGTTIPGHGHYSIGDLLALVLGEIKRRADEIVGENVTKVVLGKPAFFSHNAEDEALAEKRLRDAATKAGFVEIHFQQEPVAAAYYYEATLECPQLVFVADIGGGTSDFTLVRLSPEHRVTKNRARDILAVDNVYVGGDDFDSEIMRHRLLSHFGAGIKYNTGEKWLPIPASLLQQICQWRTIPLLRDRHTKEFLDRLLVTADNKKSAHCLHALVNQNLGFALFRAIESAKCALSSVDEAVVSFEHESGINIHETITRTQFDIAIGDELTRIRECIDDLLVTVGVSHEVDAVFLTGGGSQVPAVQELLEEQFGADKLKTGDTFLSVAAGLALSSRFFI